MFTKRARGKNFSDSEEHILLDLLKQHNAVLQIKKSDAVTWQRKKETWERIAEEFADRTGVSRPWTALRDKYDNMKRKSRNDIEPGRRKTYGDTPSFSGSSVSEKVGDLIEITGRARLENQFDSDAPEPEGPAEAFQIWSQKRFRACEPPILPDHRGKASLEEEKVELVKLQQEYYRDANSRAAEKHKYEIEKQIVELQTMRLKSQLIEMEIEEKREELAKKKKNS
ncbi:hypothetical protein KR054_002569 [Drosophila jambulina]|nr:hypothetical protein KR054_002569 [Drosophila jambulina]